MRLGLVGIFSHSPWTDLRGVAREHSDGEIGYDTGPAWAGLTGAATPGPLCRL